MADIARVMPERQALVRRLAEEQSVAIQKAGFDSEDFGKAVVEAVAANSSIVLADKTSFAHAIRKCLRDGLLPDNEEAALVVFRDKRTGKSNATYIPMKTGLQRMFVRETGAELKSGGVYEGDKVRVVKNSSGDDQFEVEQDPFAPSRKMVGVWCYVKLPNRNGEIYTMNAEEIGKVKAASRSERGPWKTWPEQMAEKAVIKRAINQLRYLIPKTGRLVAQLDEGDELGNVVIDNPVVEDVPEIEDMELSDDVGESDPEPEPETEDVELPKRDDGIVDENDISLVF